MPESNKRFHEFALKSVLFKGRSDWYFCYLKAEKIAHVLSAVVGGAPLGQPLLEQAGELPGGVVHLAAGEVDVALVLADVFGILSNLRLCVARGALGKETGAVIGREYESLAERLVAGSHLSPFVSSDDLRLGVADLEAPLLPSFTPHTIKDIKDTGSIRQTIRQDKGQSDRMTLIFNFIQKNKKVSIRDISAVIKDCSEKTIQRELGALIERGLIRKTGERRWSLYEPV